MPNERINEAICGASILADRSLRSAGALVREKPGVSKVSTVKSAARFRAVASKAAQSPSPDGISTISGPLPRRSQYQLIPPS